MLKNVTFSPSLPKFSIFLATPPIDFVDFTGLEVIDVDQYHNKTFYQH